VNNAFGKRDDETKTNRKEYELTAFQKKQGLGVLEIVSCIHGPQKEDKERNHIDNHRFRLKSGQRKKPKWYDTVETSSLWGG